MAVTRPLSVCDQAVTRETHLSIPEGVLKDLIPGHTRGVPVLRSKESCLNSSSEFLRLKVVEFEVGFSGGLYQEATGFRQAGSRCQFLVGLSVGNLGDFQPLGHRCGGSPKNVSKSADLCKVPMTGQIGWDCVISS